MLEKLVGKIKDTKFAGVPIGDALLLLVGLGINDALVPTLTRLVKFPILSGASIAFLSKLPMSERFLGPTMANVISATAIAVGVEDTIALKARVQAFISSITGRIAPTAGAITSGASSNTPVSLGQVNISEQERRILETLKVKR